jgi:hypothetical protein
VDWRDEPVSPARLGLDKVRTPRTVSERVPDPQDLILQDLGLDVGIGPQRVEQLILGDEAARVVHQILQNAERLGFE